MDGSILMTTV